MASRPTRSPRGLPTEVAVVLARMEEKLNAIQTQAQERGEASHLVAIKLETQQQQINQLATDMAILRTQHANFWKGATVLMGTLSFIGGIIGWALSMVPQIFHK